MSPAKETFTALGASVSGLKVFIPTAKNSLSVLNYNTLNSFEFGGTESARGSQSDRVHPILGLFFVPLDMHMHRFRPFIRIEEKAIGAAP